MKLFLFPMQSRLKRNEIISATDKEFRNYFKIISATLNTLDDIHELQQSSEIILK